MTVHIEPYEKFAEHYQDLPASAQHALLTFLRDLQRIGPYDSSVMNDFEKESDEQYSYEYLHGHTVFWKVLNYESANIVTPSEHQTIFLRLTAIGTVKTDRRSSV